MRVSLFDGSAAPVRKDGSFMIASSADAPDGRGLRSGPKLGLGCRSRIPGRQSAHAPGRTCATSSPASPRCHCAPVRTAASRRAVATSTAPRADAPTSSDPIASPCARAASCRRRARWRRRSCWPSSSSCSATRRTTTTPAARARRAAAASAERARLAREQRPHHALAGALRDGALGAPPATRLRRRRALVERLEASITDDARGRVARHELEARAIRATHCHALGNGVRGDELDLGKALGRYSCEAAVETASNAGITSTLGVPFVGTVDFAARPPHVVQGQPRQRQRRQAGAGLRAPGAGMHRGAWPGLRVGIPDRAARLSVSPGP